MAEYFSECTNCDEELKFRFILLTESFRKKYNCTPDFFVRVPGRVNLIGEHVDYNGYNVCPMAIKQSIVAAVRATNNYDVHISNINSQDYEDLSCKINNFKIKSNPNNAPAWYDYLLCGFQGILETTPKSHFKGLILLIHGTIPPSAGLSSSSALVCTAALSLSTMLNIHLSRQEMAELTAKAEHYIGTEGGGMDQAIIFNGKQGIASHISFNPLCLTEIRIPTSGSFVIAQSMVTKNKAASNDFNCRVVECRLASLIIAKTKKLENWQKYIKLANVQRALQYNLGQMLEVVKDEFHDGHYTRKEVCKILEMNETELEDTVLTRNTKYLHQFKLKPRALHVFGEALRTEIFCKSCETTQSLVELGRLMTESHESLKNLYECSHPELDKLVNICMTYGAFGARLTGAGWGGCVVALVSSSTAEEFVLFVKDFFYKDKVFSKDDMNSLIFITKPDAGASVFSSSILQNK